MQKWSGVQQWNEYAAKATIYKLSRLNKKIIC